jgi:hypothetical protein
MKYIENLPFYSFIEGQEVLDCAIWESKENICELQLTSIETDTGSCDNSGILYGTSNEDDPKFCARHFYQVVVGGDGVTKPKLIDIPDAKIRGLV